MVPPPALRCISSWHARWPPPAHSSPPPLPAGRSWRGPLLGRRWRRARHSGVPRRQCSRSRRPPRTLARRIGQSLRSDGAWRSSGHSCSSQGCRRACFGITGDTGVSVAVTRGGRPELNGLTHVDVSVLVQPCEALVWRFNVFGWQVSYQSSRQQNPPGGSSADRDSPILLSLTTLTSHQ